MKKKSIISLALATAMICSLFTGCIGGKTVMKIGGNSISEEIYGAAMGDLNNMYLQSYGISIADIISEGMGDEEMFKEEISSRLKQFEVIALFAKEHGVKLDSEDRKAIAENKKLQIESVGGKKAFLDTLAESGVNEAYFDYIVERQQIYYKAYDELFAGDGEFAPTEEEVVEKMAGYARVKHVLIQATEGDEDYAEKKAQAEKIAARAKAGEDFDALIAEIAETGDGDPGMQSNPNGYIIDESGYTADGSGRMVTEFTEASHALAENAVSGVVPSSYGFHIIKRYPFDSAYITENYDEYASYAALGLYEEELANFIQDVEIEYTKAYDELDIYEILGAEKTLGAGDSSAEHSEDDGHDHGTDAEGENSAEDETDTAADNAEGSIESADAAAQ